MTDYYVSSVDGNDGDAGTSWAAAKATLTGALAVATSSGDVIRVSHVHQEVLAADTTYTAGANVNIIVVDRSSSDALAVMDGTNGYIGHTSTSYAVTFAGAYKVYIRGVYFYGGGSSAKTYNLATTDGSHFEFEACTFRLTGNSGSFIGFGLSGATSNNFAKLVDCTIVLTNTSQRWAAFFACKSEMFGVVTSGTARFAIVNGRAGALYAEACDFSSCSNADMFADNVNAAFTATLVNCKLPTGVSVLAAQTTHPNRASTDVLIFNCDDGDEHFRLAHYNGLGETTISTSIYANDGASYDGSNRCGWKIVTTANSSYYTPYVSPWMDVYHSGTSAISPYLEILRSGSTTKYQDDEVWGEFSYQGTSGSTKATIVNDRMTPLGTAADQTASSLDASGWTGEDATNNAFMKLEAGSITPAEIGHIRARVCVGEPSITVYVDPKIRGLS